MPNPFDLQSPMLAVKIRQEKGKKIAKCPYCDLVLEFDEKIAENLNKPCQHFDWVDVHSWKVQPFSDILAYGGYVHFVNEIKE